MAILGILLMIFGIYRGEMSVVFTKAINICMECIGIGSYKNENKRMAATWNPGIVGTAD